MSKKTIPSIAELEGYNLQQKKKKAATNLK